MNPFDQAWAIVKADSEYWDEFFAPVASQTSGMGALERGKEGEIQPLDFMPMEDAMKILMSGRFSEFLGGDSYGDMSEETYKDIIGAGSGDEQWYVDDLVDSMEDEGYNNQLPGEWGPLRPELRFTARKIAPFEGRHRMLALERLGAPYVPITARHMGLRTPIYDHAIDHQYPIGDDMQEWLKTNLDYNLAEYMARGDIPIPPSFLYGRELVPGKGRLVPTMPGGGEMDISSHIGRNKHLMDWKKRPAWKVVHDD
tara:strand:+ start:231 stop:995 length:765 start_codon:yes stop_codon:yes gene_type:complete